jgi:acetolactate synthase I/III small subunit
VLENGGHAQGRPAGNSRIEEATMATPASPGLTSTSTQATASSRSGRIRHVLSALVQNQPGVLAQVSGMFSSRGFNIDSLAVGETENPVLSRITVVAMGDDRHLEQVRKQLEKLIPVVKVQDISGEDYVERDLMLIKIKAPAAVRPEIQSLVQIFRGRIVDVSPDLLMIEIAGQEKKIEAFIEAVRPYGIIELARTGRIALVRGAQPMDDGPEQTTAPSLADDDEPIIQGHSEL